MAVVNAFVHVTALHAPPSAELMKIAVSIKFYCVGFKFCQLLARLCRLGSDAACGPSLFGAFAVSNCLVAAVCWARVAGDCIVLSCEVGAVGFAGTLLVG